MATDGDNSLLWAVLIVIGIVIAILILFPLLMMVVGISMGGMMGGIPGPGGMSPFWGLGMVVLFLVVLGGFGYPFYQAAS